MKPLNFGIIGPGKIAKRFAECFQFVPGAKVYSIASRDISKAKEFGAAFGAERVYGYEDIVKDPNVDVIYIATPHPFHYEQTLLCLNHGKAVLCEKPLAMNLKQATEMIEVARRNKVFLMEGMWSRFFPGMKKVLELVQSGVIGGIEFFQADFGFSGPVILDGRLYNLKLGGGAQLDVGVYPLFFALLLLGKPKEVKSFSRLTTTGADATTSALFNYSNGVIAQILSSIVTDTPKDAHIMGTLGRITLHSPWHKSEKVSLRLNAGDTTEFPFPHSGNGFEFQLEEVVKCLQAGKTECELMPHSLSLMMAEISDEIRKQGGVVYGEDR